MDWQVDTVTELHKATWMETSFPLPVWKEEHTAVLPAEWKAHTVCVDEFSIQEPGKDSGGYQTPPVPKHNRLGLHSRKSKHEHQDEFKWYSGPSI